MVLTNCLKICFECGKWDGGEGEARLASHSLFSDWTGAGEKGLVTLGHILCLYQNLGRDYSLIFPRDPKIA